MKIEGGHVLVGIGMLGVAGVLLVMAASTQQPPPEGTCKLAATGVEQISDGLKGESSLVGLAGKVAASYSEKQCDAFIANLQADSGRSLTYQLQLQDGSWLPQTVSASQLTAPPPPSTVPDVFACLRWNNDYLFGLCADGTIPEPIG